MRNHLWNEVVLRYFGRLLHHVSKYWNRFSQQEESNFANVGSFYGNDDTTSSCKTLGQIGLLQVAFYICVIATLWLLESIFGFPFEQVFRQVFSYEVWKTSTAQGFLVPCAFLLNSVWMAAWLLIIVKRAKKCLDFVITMYLLHFVFCTGFYSFPYSWSWWLFMLIQVSISTLLGERLCMKRELQDIMLIPSVEDNGTPLSQIITIESNHPSHSTSQDAYRKN
ncbi:Protein SYS1 [Galdieria sulphuraria]|nr:Protein SYS1 [Galdieria sulphuraria]